ncbi:GTP-binding protein YsxC [Linnemannia elongata]|nr:GTP-binding protein YsxC [Linnemannia elongata]
MSAEEIQKLRDRKRAKEHEIKDSTLPEIAIVGRSNVGKSTMLNTLTESPNTARVSSKPGLTRQLNFYRCGDKFVVVDMPGYGFAFAKEEDKTAWKELIEDYLGTRKSLKRIYVMIDARHGLKVADKEFLTMMGANSSKKFQVVLTKCDLVSPPDLARTYMVVQEELKKSFKNAMTDRILMVSSYTGAGMNTLRKDMLFACGQNILVRERERPKSTLRY